jgi:hypothetical protein
MLRLKAFCFLVATTSHSWLLFLFLRLVSSFARDRTGWDFCSKSGGVNLLCTVLVGRTLEQQGREDDEGKGWRLAVDAKSDLC